MVSMAEPETLETEAVIVADPCLVVVARPAATVTELVDEDHVAVLVRSCVVPLL
jgi:hypothetical protein